MTDRTPADVIEDAHDHVGARNVLAALEADGYRVVRDLSPSHSATMQELEQTRAERDALAARLDRVRTYAAAIKRRLDDPKASHNGGEAISFSRHYIEELIDVLLAAFPRHRGERP